jgi:hypothetical protein
MTLHIRWEKRTIKLYTSLTEYIEEEILQAKQHASRALQYEECLFDIIAHHSYHTWSNVKLYGSVHTASVSNAKSPRSAPFMARLHL